MWNEEQQIAINGGLDDVIKNERLFYSQLSYARALLESIAPTLRDTNTFAYTSRAERYYNSQNPEIIKNRNGTQYQEGSRSIRAMVTEELALRRLVVIDRHGPNPVACVNKGVTTFQDQIKIIPNDNTASDDLKFVVSWYKKPTSSPVINKKNMEKLSMYNNDKIKPLNTIKYGPPGTGKTYSLAIDILKIINANTTEIKSIHQIIHFRPKNFKQVEFITFHQSYSYEEFVEGIRAEVVKGQVTYKIHNGIFKRLCRRAYIYKIKAVFGGDNTLFTTNALADYEILTTLEFKANYPELWSKLDEHESGSISDDSASVKIPKFVLCIDEINRANISRVFGELITLIEDTKRQGEKETISVTLPYSGDEFFVPDNLYILGTMNTADRSLAKLDLALRRRFYFEAYYPDLNQVKNATAKDILEKLNEFISKELDREYTIGHSYLMAIDEDADGDTLKEALADAFTGKIIPLLEEYFLHEPTKVKEAITAAGLANYVANI